ncbi:MAG: START-like domain-containing protein [Edaphocola sp.]
MKNTKTMFTVEVPLRCSPPILFDFLSTANGLQEWFADKVDHKDDNFYFTWNGSTDEAEQIAKEENEYVRYRWDYGDDDEYFELRITQSPVTNETILQVTDFADSYDVKDQQQLWLTQINNLKHRIGS